MAKFIEIDSVYENCLHKSFKYVLTKLLCLKFYSLIFNGCFDWTISNCAHFLQYKNGQHCTKLHCQATTENRNTAWTINNVHSYNPYKIVYNF